MSGQENIFIGVGAVVFKGDDILVIKRGKPPFQGQWSIPGGGLENGERLVDAVIREVREETGLEIELLGLLNVFEAIPAETGFPAHTILIDYVAEWISGEPAAADDAMEAEFVSMDEAVSRLSWDVTRQAVAQAVQKRKDFGGPS
ncbi:NUDIX domain-containing protein [Hyphococcus flavus]|uniref:NUDIX domain-containing protein n=1 Tax=Hyphococcus flavus TaxID=1866326 RepID=A0AAF0CG37_9PROT|nr:NUDIX domain-containing protein [Hyphococcus flavus]WDI31753.1 NUDIX domain-containing protein [Hyphococcus flavus]